MTLMAIAVLSKLAGFLREILLAFYYGASNISDAYLISLTIPGVLFSIVGVGLSVAFIPVYLDVAVAERSAFVGKLTGIVFAIATLVVMVTVAFAEPLVSLFAPGFNAATKSQAVTYTRIFVFGVYLSALIHIYTGVLHSERRLLIPALAGLAFSIIVAGSIVISSWLGVIVLIFGPLLGKLFEVLLMWPQVRRLGISSGLSIDLKDPNVRYVIAMTAPLTLGIAANEINSLVGRALASEVGVGGVSALSYAQQLNQLVVGVIALSIATTIFPKLAGMFISGESGGLSRLVRDALRYTILLVVPCSVFFSLFSTEVVSAIYARGSFGGNAVTMTAQALFFYSIGLAWFAFREILARVFYAMKDPRTPVNNAIFGVLINIALSLVLAPIMGVGGLALATSISAIVTTSILLFLVRRRVGASVLRGVLRDVALLILASTIAGVGVKSFAVALPFVFTPFVQIFVNAAIFFIVYFSVCLGFGLDTVRDPVKLAWSKFSVACQRRGAP